MDWSLTGIAPTTEEAFTPYNKRIGRLTENRKMPKSIEHKRTKGKAAYHKKAYDNDNGTAVKALARIEDFGHEVESALNQGEED